MFGIAITDKEWLDFLAEEGAPEVVNFWTPTPWKVRSLTEGDRWYFMLKSPIRRVAGYGVFLQYEELTVEQAWERYGAGNGVVSKDVLLGKITAYAEKNSEQFIPSSDPTIGCVLLSDVEVWSADAFIDPAEAGCPFPASVVKWKRFDGDTLDQVPAGEWTDGELRASVSAYLDMLEKETAGEAYNKAAVNRNLRQGPLHRRTKASVEFRMQNISATLEELYSPWITGYKPARNVGPTVTDKIRGLLLNEGFDGAVMAEGAVQHQELETKTNAIRKKLAGRTLTKEPSGQQAPREVTSTVKQYERDPLVKVWILEAAGGRCEACESEAPFVNRDGLPYLEVHHVVPLAKGGPDVVSNAVAVCPNCHRHLHYGIDAGALVKRLYDTVTRLNEQRDPVGGDRC